MDARRKDEYDVSHIPDSIRLHFQADDGELKAFLDSIGKEEAKVVCYCSLGYRSSILANRLGRMANDDGNIKIFNMASGIFKWANEERPMVDHKGSPTTFVHPFSYIYGLLLNRSNWKMGSLRDYLNICKIRHLDPCSY